MATETIELDREIFNTYNFNKKLDNWFVFGHHPHLISGIAKNNIYSLGNTFIPHPNYYKRFEGVRYGLAVLLDTAANDYTLKLTEVKSNDHFNKDFVLFTKAFNDVPKEVKNYDKNFSQMRKLFLKLFAFKNTKLDLLKLYFLQLTAQLFHLKAVLKKGNYDK